MLGLWKQASEKANATSTSSAYPGPVNGNKRPLEGGTQSSKRRRVEDFSQGVAAVSRTVSTPLSTPVMGDLPRPLISAEDASAHLQEQNVIAVVESQEEKLGILRSLIGQRVATHKANRAVNGTQSHRFVLFVVDDNYAIGQYANELENEDFTVGAYTVALHSSSVNEWPSVVYNDVVIVSANMLLDSLVEGNVKLSQAHLIVVSDAQRLIALQIPHPIMRMMTDHYAKIFEPPRVLAMVTSAPDRWASLDLARLEMSFSARAFFIATTKVAEGWLDPVELVLEYSPYATMPTEVPAAAKLREADPNGSIVKPHHFRRAHRVLQQLGPYACNLAWKETLGELTAGAGPDDPTSPNASVRQRLAEMLRNWSDEPLVVALDSPACNITPKVAKLLQILSSYDESGNDFRGIVLVEDRAVARFLSAILQRPEVGLPFVRAVDVHPRVVSDPTYQEEISRGFNEGHHTLLILTRSIEDVDLPRATTVISFDLFDDQLTYAYCQAHTKGRSSHLLHMVESGNHEQRRILTHIQTVDPELRSWMTEFAKGDSTDMPPSSLFTCLDSRLSESEDSADYENEYLLEPTTSARLYKVDAEAAIYRFAMDIQGNTIQPGDKPSISLAQHDEGNQENYQYTVSFPKSLNIPDVHGPYCPSKTAARREAFYAACREFVRVGLMDYRHFPQPRWRPAEQHPNVGESDTPQEVKTANSSSATHGYPRKAPDFWANSPRYPVTTLYPTVIVPDNLAGQPHAPVALLTRAPLPQVPDSLVFFSSARATVRFHRGAPFEASAVQLQALQGYTNRVVRSLTNKPFDCPAESLLCFFAPLRSSWQPIFGAQNAPYHLSPVGPFIPWDAIQLAADYFAVPLYSNLTSLDDNARDAIVQDRNVEFTMRHFLVKVRHDLTPLSKADDSPREAEYPNFLEYCKARRKDFPGLEDEKQPMIEVTAVPGVINNLHPTAAPPTLPAKAPLKYLIPELTYKFTIPASTFRTLWLLPSIMTKVDSWLLVKELDAKLFHHAISEPQLLVALSTRAAWTESNYERLEFLGDAFLKVIASNFLYVTMPTAGEGALHHTRQGIIGNKTLHECAMRLGVCPYVQHKRFVAKLWQPPHVPASSAEAAAAGSGAATSEDVEMQDAEEKGKNRQKRTKKQRQLDMQNTLWMGDKVVADVVEAILAAAFLSGGHERALQAARKLQIPLPNIAQWTDFTRIGAQNEVQSTNAPASSLLSSTVEAVQALVGSVFSKPDLLAQALTHGSAFGGAEGASYERLEFIGDAILDFLVARHIFQQHPHLSPGGLTLLKGGMVSNRALAAFCVHMGLHRHLHFASDQLAHAIRRYVDALADLRQKEYDAATREQRLPGQYWLDMPLEPPKCLSDVVESVIGALYVCDGFFEVGVGRFFETAFKPFMDAHVRLQTLSTNPKVTLLELLQAEGCRQHAVVKVPQDRQNAPVHMEVHVHGQVIASVVDPTATVATRKVALAALDVLANDPELLPRICDCAAGDGVKKQQPKTEDPAQEEAEAAEVEEAMEALESAE